MQKAKALIKSWRADWNRFAADALDCRLDKQQQEILHAVQTSPKVSVASGTARGKDYVTAVASLCFLYLTPRWNDAGELVANTKVALTAPTDRQVKNIMMPEIARLYNAGRKKGIAIGRLNAYDIRTHSPEWFLTGFKADEYNHEAWSGFHAVNTMFAVTEASGIPDTVFDAIEGNLQGNSRLLIVFNPNSSTGYAAQSQKKEGWAAHRLSSLDAPNVLAKRIVIPGQVDFPWLVDKIKNWCTPVADAERLEEMDDFEFEGVVYRPDDLFRVKVLGKFPKVPSDTLIPQQWIELANERWLKGNVPDAALPLQLGVDVAGMGRDNTVYCHRYGNIVTKLEQENAGGKANHMHIAGKIVDLMRKDRRNKAAIDTIGEGAGVYARCEELGLAKQALSCKFSENAQHKKDITGIYEFANMRAYLFWAVRDWLNPKNNTGAALPPDKDFLLEATSIKWKFRSDGKIIIEPKADIKKRIGRSTDKFDALANTFYISAAAQPQSLEGLFF